MANLPDKYIAVIEDTDEARDAHGHAYGSVDISLGAREIKALEDGKAVASFDGEYVTYITFETPVAAKACDVPLSPEAEIRDIRQPDIGAGRDEGANIISMYVGNREIHLFDQEARKLIKSLVSALSDPMTAKTDRRLKDWREASGFTQQQAADAVGISRTYMGQIEQGKAKNLTLATARKIAALYDCDVSELNIDL